MVNKQRRKSDLKNSKRPIIKSWPTVARDNEKRAQLLGGTTRGAAVFNGRGLLIDCNYDYAALYRLPDELTQRGTPMIDILNYQVDQGNIPDLDPETFIAGHMNMTRKTTVDTRIQTMPDGKVLSIGHIPIDGGGWIMTLDDVSDFYAIKAEIEHSSLYDRRTSLPNERLLVQALDDAFAQQWDEESFALMAIDFSTFDPEHRSVSQANHAILMVQIADRLSQSVRSTDLSAKLEGARFAVLQGEVTAADDAEALARRLATVLAMPYTVDGQTLMPSFHIGITMPHQEDMPEDALISLAFEGAKQARSFSRQRYAFYCPPEMAKSA